MDSVVKRTGGVALWRQISDRMRAMIDEGSFDGADRLPSEAELAVRFGVNRHTIRAAIADLVRAGVLRSQQGVGTFVSKRRRLAYPITAQTRFSAGLDGQAASIETLLLDEGTELATARIAAALELAAGTVLVRLETVGLADGVPVSCATHWFEAGRFAALAEHVRATGSISKSLERLGLADYARASTAISAGHAHGRDGETLRLGDNAVVLMVEAVNVHDGRPIQFSRTRFAADRIELTVAGPDQEALKSGPTRSDP